MSDQPSPTIVELQDQIKNLEAQLKHQKICREISDLVIADFVSRNKKEYVPGTEEYLDIKQRLNDIKVHVSSGVWPVNGITGDIKYLLGLIETFTTLSVNPAELPDKEKVCPSCKKCPVCKGWSIIVIGYSSDYSVACMACTQLEGSCQEISETKVAVLLKGKVVEMTKKEAATLILGKYFGDRIQDNGQPIR